MDYGSDESIFIYVIYHYLPVIRSATIEPNQANFWGTGIIWFTILILMYNQNNRKFRLVKESSKLYSQRESAFKERSGELVRGAHVAENLQRKESSDRATTAL